VDAGEKSTQILVLQPPVLDALALFLDASSLHVLAAQGGAIVSCIFDKLTIIPLPHHAS
jgi:hypothetical protein